MLFLLFEFSQIFNFSNFFMYFVIIQRESNLNFSSLSYVTYPIYVYKNL